MKSPITDDMLRATRDTLMTSLGRMPRALEIRDTIKQVNGYDMDDSTIRGRFITMGESLRGGNRTNATTPTPKPTNEDKAVKDTVKPVLEQNKPHDVPDELKAYIPEDADFSTYVNRSTDMRLSIHYSIGPASGRYKYPITQGKQGTGKTFSHAYYAWKQKLPFFLYSCYEDFKLPKLFGDKTIKDGSVVFQESLFVKAIQAPSVILFDEVNAISNTNTFDFHALLQNRELFVKDANNGNGKVYKLHPECRIGFAQNPKSAKYIGGNVKPSNFLGRCTFLTYPEFTEAEIIEAMEKKFNMTKADLKKFVKYYFACIKVIEQAGLPLDISIRQLVNTIDLWLHGMELKDALDDGLASMLEACSQPDAKESFQKIAQAVWKELMPAEDRKVS